jgi:hypothetical protein
MESWKSFLRFVAKAVLDEAGFGLAGEFAVEVLPEIVKDVWKWWSKDRTEEQRREDVQAVAALSPAKAREEAREAVAEESDGRSEEGRQLATVYLKLIPESIRRSQSRPEDPIGKTVSPRQPLNKPEDLKALLPPRLPWFRPGQRPLPGVDLKLVKLLGLGGFGEVWKARNPHFDGMPPVALKFCRDTRGAKHEAEVVDRVMRQGKRRGIVQLRHTYLDAPTPCLEYELVEGGDLTLLVNQQLAKGKLRPELARKIIRRLARTLGRPHQLTPPVVHRDMKPANVLVQRKKDDRTVTLRIADFGIGEIAANQAIEQEKTRRGRTIWGAHTPHYASPQQTDSKPPHPTDDVYALGVMWHQMLDGDLNRGAPTGTTWRIIEFVLLRNVHVHNRGIVDKRYLDEKKNVDCLKQGDVAVIDQAYWQMANRVCKTCVERVAAWAEA